MRNISRKFLSIIFIFTLSAFAFAFEKPIVTDISAQYANGRKISISWILPKNLRIPITKLLLYRNTSPITTFADINDCYFVKELPATSTGYTDTLADFNDYFYVVIAYTDEPYKLIMPSLNATTDGVHLVPKKVVSSIPKKEKEEKLYPSGTLRETPLPYLDLIEGLDESENKISDEAKNHARGLGINLNRKKTVLPPHFFEEDLISPEKGDAYFLFQILSETFAPQKYDEAIVQLKKLLGTKINQDVLNRATFYLGESYYYTGDAENAVKSFIQVKEVFPSETKKWIEAALDEVTIY